MTNQQERTGGRLMVLTGPTAVGKGTVEAALRKQHPEVWVSVSATTRATARRSGWCDLLVHE